jgi:hypothetical protein
VASVLAVVELALKAGETCQRYYVSMANARRDIDRIRYQLENRTDVRQIIR